MMVNAIDAIASTTSLPLHLGQGAQLFLTGYCILMLGNNRENREIGGIKINFLNFPPKATQENIIFFGERGR